jgi:thiamine biosynthesis lipoprotein
MSPESVRRSFPAMGGIVEVKIVGDDPSALARIERLFEAHDLAMSLHRGESELSALNASPATPFRASPVLFDAVSEAIGWACVTDGVFDPTVAEAVDARVPLRSGREGRIGGAVLDRPATCGAGRWRRVALDFERETIELPTDVKISLDGIGKGYAVDRAIAAIGPHGNALVSASGDLYAAGDGPDGDGWYVGVQNPLLLGKDLTVLNVNDRGVATAGTSAPTGMPLSLGLIDRRSAGDDLLSITVVALTATQADVLSQTAIRLGAEAGLRMVERFEGAECIAVTAARDVLTTRGMAEYFA